MPALGWRLSCACYFVQVVDQAVANADRYYRLVSMGMASRSGDAEWEAALFKAAAAQWLAEKKANSSLNALLQIFEVRTRGVTSTGDLQMRCQAVV